MRKVGGRVLAPMLAAACVALLSACDEVVPGTDGAAATPASPAATPAAGAFVPAAIPAGAFDKFRWSPQGTATMSTEGPPAKMNLKQGGVVLAVFDGLNGAPPLPVAAGETLTVRMNASGTPGKTLKAMLTRQCDQEKGEDALGNAIELSATPRLLEISLTFQKAYGCVRVDLTSLDGSPIDVDVSDLYITKSAGAAVAPAAAPPAVAPAATPPAAAPAAAPATTTPPPAQ